jgi:hypothetical protein
MNFHRQSRSRQEPSAGWRWADLPRLAVSPRQRECASQDIDLTGFLLFLVHLQEADPEVAQLVQLILDDDGVVQSLSSPGHEDVWRLEMLRGDWLVLFRIQNGIVDSPRVRCASVHVSTCDESRPLGLAIFAWARAQGVAFRLDDPEDINHDLVNHGRAAIDWLSTGQGPALERVYCAWLTYRYASARLEGSVLWASLAHTVDAMETAAVSQTTSI